MRVFKLIKLNLGSTTHIVHEPARNGQQSQTIRSDNNVYIIHRDPLPSYNEVVIDDLPTYEEIIRTKAEINRSFDGR